MDGAAAQEYRPGLMRSTMMVSAYRDIWRRAERDLLERMAWFAPEEPLVPIPHHNDDEAP